MIHFRPLNLFVAFAGLFSSTLADSLERYECFCAGNNLSGFYFEYHYNSDRLGETVVAQQQCHDVIGNPPPCSTDIYYEIDICGTDANGVEFCYDKDVFSGDDYTFDGSERELNTDNAQDLGGLESYCQSVCEYMDPGLSTDCEIYGCKAQIFYDLEQL
ncbi:hypothetical protein BDY21DRAFT_345448 [Lineolata rhizophorae]|uniref:Uncharacterized protein n=1 Tax=Lineolata rhizophorae TaxID=578093 RepID=A0A6A6P0M1_9PEZI|nr:hypothetical protein BDY21DRAFT_345448 [Lineolata rhizophorae]